MAGATAAFLAEWAEHEAATAAARDGGPPPDLQRLLSHVVPAVQQPAHVDLALAAATAKACPKTPPRRPQPSASDVQQAVQFAAGQDGPQRPAAQDDGQRQAAVDGHRQVAAADDGQWHSASAAWHSDAAAGGSLWQAAAGDSGWQGGRGQANSVTESQLADYRAEEAVAREFQIPWQQRGPPGHSGTWRSQVYREGGQRWGNRGGASRDWYRAYYVAKGKGKSANAAAEAADEELGKGSGGKGKGK